MSRYPCIKEKLVELKPEELSTLLEQAKQQGVLIGRAEVHAQLHDILTAVGYIKPATEQAPAAETPAATQQQPPATPTPQPTTQPTTEPTVTIQSPVAALGLPGTLAAGLEEYGIHYIDVLINRGSTLKGLGFSDEQIKVIDAKLEERELPKLKK